MSKMMGWYHDSSGTLLNIPSNSEGSYNPITKTGTYSFPVPGESFEYFTYWTCDDDPLGIERLRAENAALKLRLAQMEQHALNAAAQAEGGTELKRWLHELQERLRGVAVWYHNRPKRHEVDMYTSVPRRWWLEGEVILALLTIDVSDTD